MRPGYLNAIAKAFWMYQYSLTFPNGVSTPFFPSRNDCIRWMRENHGRKVIGLGYTTNQIYRDEVFA